MAQCCGKHARKGKYCKDCPRLDGVGKKKRKKSKKKAKEKAIAA